jgi:hypothetical protein
MLVRAPANVRQLVFFEAAHQLASVRFCLSANCLATVVLA